MGKTASSQSRWTASANVAETSKGEIDIVGAMLGGMLEDEDDKPG
jgi:hypothetical protein